MGGEGGKGGGEAGEKQIRAPGNPYSSFSSSSSLLCIRRGFDKKLLLSAVPYIRFDVFEDIWSMRTVHRQPLSSFFAAQIYVQYNICIAKAGNFTSLIY